MTSPQPQAWQSSPAQPARAIGLGLLYAGGYLTSKGAQILYCPSNNSPKFAKENRWPKYQRYDGDEPFWTSQGHVIRGDGDSLGDLGINEQPDYSDVCYNPTGSPAVYYASMGICQVLSNYTIRRTRVEHVSMWANGAPGTGDGYFWLDSALKLEEFGKAGVLADSLNIWIGHAWRNYGERTLPFTSWPAAPQRYEVLRDYPSYKHDNTWNVLFPDGAVKTLGDGSKAVYRALVDCYQECGYTMRNSMLTGASTRYNKSVGLEPYVWEQYLDDSYQQD